MVMDNGYHHDKRGPTPKLTYNDNSCFGDNLIIGSLYLTLHLVSVRDV